MKNSILRKTMQEAHHARKMSENTRPGGNPAGHPPCGHRYSSLSGTVIMPAPTSHTPLFHLSASTIATIRRPLCLCINSAIAPPHAFVCPENGRASHTRVYTPDPISVSTMPAYAPAYFCVL